MNNKVESMPMIETFEYSGLPSRVLCAPDSVERLADEVRRLGCSRVLLLTGRRSGQSKLAKAVKLLLGDLLADSFDGVVEHSSVSMVNEVGQRARDGRIDLLLAVGGGSPSDTAKGVAILLAEGAPLEQHAGSFTPPDNIVQRELHKPKIPIIVIPTTASAAEVTPGLGIRDEQGHKLLFWDTKLIPRVTILDPAANLEVPTHLMTTSSMNALAHCIEGLYSKRRNPISEGLALHSIRLLTTGLRAMIRNPQSVDARARILSGAHMSGMVIGNTRVCIHHAICHCLGGLGGLSHGVANSIMLPHAMRFNLPFAGDKLALSASAFGVNVQGLSEAEAAQSAIQAVENLQREIGVPRRLQDTALSHDLLEAIADYAMNDRGLYYNPGPTPTRQDVLKLLEAAW